LRALKVGYRAKMIKRISESFAKGEINEFELRKMATEEAKNELMKLYGGACYSSNNTK
jgi:3-methyladenine DNA glycosylase/8-oxoguanine DNA glycosylase